MKIRLSHQILEKPMAARFIKSRQLLSEETRLAITDSVIPDFKSPMTISVSLYTYHCNPRPEDSPVSYLFVNKQAISEADNKVGVWVL